MKEKVWYIEGVPRKEPKGMPELMKLFVSHYGLTAELNRHRVLETWDTVSGAAAFTIGKYYKGGKLSVSISSSMVRSQLCFQKEGLIQAINERLAEDPLFQADCEKVGFVKDIILR